MLAADNQEVQFHYFPLTLCIHPCRICQGLSLVIHGWTLLKVMLLYGECLLGIHFEILMLAIVRYTLYPVSISIVRFVILINAVFFVVVVAGTKLCCGVTITCDEDRRRRVLDASCSFGKRISP